MTIFNSTFCNTILTFYLNCITVVIIGSLKVVIVLSTKWREAAVIFVILQVGDHNAWSSSDGTYYDVCTINDHPNYNDNTLEYDYSVLTLCTPLTISEVGCFQYDIISTIFIINLIKLSLSHNSSPYLKKMKFFSFICLLLQLKLGQIIMGGGQPGINRALQVQAQHGQSSQQGLGTGKKYPYFQNKGRDYQ